MNIEEDKKKYLIMVVLVGILFICVFISILIYIWSRPIGNSVEEKRTEDKSLGFYTNVKFSLEEQVKIYSSNISSDLTSNNIYDLFNKLSKSYIEYNSLDMEKFNKYIDEKNLNGKKLNLKEYKNTTFNNNNIIKLTFETDEKKDKSNITVTVYESSPNNYTIAFDNFISYIGDEVSYEENGLKITLYDQTVFSNEYRTKIKIENISNSNIVLNKQKASEIFYINQGEGFDKIVSSSILMGNSLNLKPSDSINYTLNFFISDFTFAKIKKLIIKDVTNESTNNTQNIEINLSSK